MQVHSPLLARVHLILLLDVRGGILWFPCTSARWVPGTAKQSVDHAIGDGDEDTDPNEAVSEDGRANRHRAEPDHHEDFPKPFHDLRNPWLWLTHPTGACGKVGERPNCRGGYD